jgi:hypothetical protein
MLLLMAFHVNGTVVIFKYLSFRRNQEKNLLVMQLVV